MAPDLLVTSVLTSAAIIVLGLLGPLAAMRLEKVSGLGWLNPVLTCYAIGLVFAFGFADSESLKTAGILRDASIPLAIPLLLFGTDLRALREVSPTMLFAFGLAVLSVLVSSTAGFFVFAEAEFRAQTAGMLVGVYTGGTPNMAAIGHALKAPEQLFVLLNATDVALGAAYLLFLLTLAGPMAARLFPAFSGPDKADEAPEDKAEIRGKDVAIGLGLAVLILGASAGLTVLVVGELHVAGVILGITTGGLAASMSRGVRQLAGTYDAGNYLILVFCVAIGAQTDLAELARAGSSTFAFVAFVLTLAIALHLLACRVARIDGETALLSSTAAVYGPPFVPLVARALGNRALIAPALCVGVLGYVVGNYLGLALAWALSAT